MAPVEALTDEQFQQHALAILGREFGVDGLARFLRVYRSGKGNKPLTATNGLPVSRSPTSPAN